MGTSSSFGGGKGKNPMIPSWLSSEKTDIPISKVNLIASKDDNKPQQTSDPKDKPYDILKPESIIVDPATIVLGDNSRFKQSRANFTRYVSSGGKNRSALKKGISSYIKNSYKGAKQASKRMAVSKITASKFVSFFIEASTQGFQATLQKYNLSNLQGLPLDQAYIALVDEFCKSDGKIDNAISRDAYLFTVEALENASMLDKLEKPSESVILFMLKNFMVLSIKNRLLEDVGQSIFLDGKDPSVIQYIEIQIKDFIGMAVDDVISKFQNNSAISDITKEMDSLYEASYSMLELIANEEEDDE